MMKARAIWWGSLMLSISMHAGAQNNPQSQTPTSQTPPSPAFGQNVPILNPENPPLSGLDEPSLELRTVNRSFVSGALQAGQSVDTNAGAQLGSTKTTGVSHVLGALDLQKLWPRSDLFLEYLGGAGFGDNDYYVRQLQALGLEAITRWRTGQLTLRDGANYLPEGSFFAASAGGLPGFGIATTGLQLGLPGLYRQTEGAIGTGPRFANTAVLDVVQAITPRSAFTVIGAYGNTHFYHNLDNLIDGDQTTVEAGYSHLISRHDQIAFVEAFQLLRFPSREGGEIYNDVFNIRWSHLISGRMSFLGAIGAQYTDVRLGLSTPNWSTSGRAVLRYQFEHASMSVSYAKLTTPGGGFFPGADRQAVEVSFRRPIGRTYEFSAVGGYSHNKRLQSSSLFGAVGANSYDDGFAGMLLKKHLGRSFDALVAYRFSEVAFNVPVKLAGSTGSTSHRQIGTIALEWHPRPIRID